VTEQVRLETRLVPMVRGPELRTHLDAAGIERVATEARRWIKALRHLPVDGVPLRDRFTYRGDSLWWFAELYLHKQGTIDRLWQTAIALDALALREREREGATRELIIVPGDDAVDLLAPQVAARHGLTLRIDTTSPHRRTSESRLALDLRSRFYTWSALASRVRVRPHRAAGARGGSGGTLAFVHSAFWRKPAVGAAGVEGDEGQEGYIGAVLRALQARAAAQPVRLVGVGPRTNFKARRWWHAIAPSRAGGGEIPVEPIERFASWRALAGSRAVWRDRFALERVLLGSDAIRAHASILGYDVWPLVADELRGVARLQFPWSARAMDEAAAAMEIVRPALVVTYAEAGGWGRALMLEARRRGIPSVGLQHGFIYRHWLNYLHDPDEMHPSPTNHADHGFPRPDRTLVYDGYAAHHLIQAGHFPSDAVTITGSPALDALVASMARIDEAERTRIRAQLAAPVRKGPDSSLSSAARTGEPESPSGSAQLAPQGSDAATHTHLIVLVTKFTQVRDPLAGLLRAVGMLENVRLVIKPHPAETAEPYRAAAAEAGVGNVIIAPASLDLARLLAVARLVVTVNSTVAIDAIALGVPAVIVGLPNNLSPFVDAGVMAGGAQTNLPDTLAALIQDEARREAQLARARAFAARQAMTPDGRAAERAADAMIDLLVPGPLPGRPV
jgi:UDP-N-acetylglucosamine 2-epimerase